MRRELVHGWNRWPKWTIPVVAVAALASIGAGQDGSTLRVSVDSNGVQGNGDSWSGSFSADGRFVVFETYATNFAAGDTNSGTDVFVHDRLNGSTTLMSRSMQGVPGDRYSFGGSISADGRYVAFASTADDLVPADSNGNVLDVFVQDRVTGVIELVSVSSTGAPGDRDSGWASRISTDGRYVVFTSYATTFIPGGTNGTCVVYLRDRATGSTTPVTMPDDGTLIDNPSNSVAVSTDGRFVMFESWVANLVPGDTNDAYDVFVRDMQTGSIECITVDGSGVPGNDWSYAGTLSPDGRYVTFASYSSNLVPGDTNAECDAFVRDRATGVTERVSVDSAGNQANGYSYPPWISDDGRYVSFDSYASNLDPRDTNTWSDGYVHDRQSGETAVVSLSSTGTVCFNGNSGSAHVSPDGRCVLFTSYCTEVPHDSNGNVDLFLRDLQGCSATIATYCAAGTTTSGCVASISGSGTPSASSGSGFVIQADSVEGHKNGMFIYGLSGPQSAPMGASFLCVLPPLQRMGLMPSGGAIGSCAGQLSIDWNHFIATHPAAVGAPFQSGEVVWVQALFRDPAAPGGTNLSNALWFNVCP